MFSDFEIIEPKLDENELVYNPYPILGSTQNPCWPRGFPLEKILDAAKSGKVEKLSKNAQSTTKFGILQSLADIQPDVDAIFRLTHETPFIFEKGRYEILFHFVKAYIRGGGTVGNPTFNFEQRVASTRPEIK